MCLEVSLNTGVFKEKREKEYLKSKQGQSSLLDQHLGSSKVRNRREVKKSESAHSSMEVES